MDDSELLCFAESAVRDLAGAIRLLPLAAEADAGDVGVARSGGLLDFGSWLELYGCTLATGLFSASAFEDVEFANSDAQLVDWAGAGVSALGANWVAGTLEDSLRLLEIQWHVKIGW